MKTINITRQKLLPFIILLLSVCGLHAQQVIGSFPTMDGGFEAQGTTMTSASYATGVQSTVWTVSTAGMGTFQTSSPRTGGKYVNINYTSTTKRLQSPTVAADAIVGGTAYTVQFYYRTAGSTAPGGTTQYTGASSDGTSPQPSMGYTTISPVLTATNGVWTKFSASVTASSSTNPSPKYGYLCAFRTSAAMAAAMDIDDVVMYQGALDVTAPDPVTEPVISAVGATQQTISWTAPGTGVDGGGYLVVRGLSDPQTIPNANGIYAIGKTVAAGEQVVYIGTTPSFTDLGLTSTTHYYYRIYTVDKAFNYSTSAAVDGTTSAPDFDSEPTAQVTGLGFTSVFSTGFTINWTAAVSGGGTNHLVVVKAGSDLSDNPVDGSSYTADPAFVSGSALGGGMVVYNGTGNTVDVTGLSKAITYYVRIYDFNGASGTENYLISNPTSGTQMASPGEIVSNGTSPSSSPKSYSDGSAWVGGVPPGQYDNVTIVSGDYLNVGSTQKCHNLTIQNDAKIYSGTAQTLQIFGSSLVCDGTFGDASVSYEAGPPPSGSTMTAEFGGNLTISGTGGIYPYKIRPVTGKSNIGVTFATNATVTYGVAGTLSDNTGNDNISFTVNNGVTLEIAGNMNTTSSVSTNGTASTIWNINGTVNVAGSFAPVVTLSKTFVANINGLLKVGNLKPTPTGGATPEINVNSGGEFYINGGTCDLSGTNPSLIKGLGTFTLGSGSTINIGASTGLEPISGQIQTSIRNFSTTANYSYVGTAAQNTGADLPSTVNNLTINNSSGVTLSGSTEANTIASNLSINTGAIFNVNPDKQLTILNTFTNDGTINLMSDATGTATILTPSTIGGSGVTNVQQYLTSNRNWYICSPVIEATSAVFTASNSANKVYWYDEVHGSSDPWPQITDDITSLNSMQGYVVNMNANGALSFTGNLNNGTKNIVLSRTVGQSKEGFNLIGNPYASYLDWDQAIKNNTSSSIWQRTKNGGGTYVFDTYNSDGQIGVSNSGASINNHIPPMQAFWVRVVDGQTSGSIEVNNTMRSHKGFQVTELGTVYDPMFKTIAFKPSVLRLQLSDDVSTDETLIYTNPKASSSFDSYDSQKLFSESGSIPEIYSIVDSENLTINGLNSIPYETEIPLGFKTEAAGVFKIKASQVSNFESGTQIYLKDKLQPSNPEIFDLTDGSCYTFTSDIVNNTSRFTLVFHSPTVYTGERNNSDSDILISTNENNQIIIKAKVTGSINVVVHNSIGQCVANQCLTSSTNVLQNKLMSGVYFVTCTNSGKTKTTKVIIN